MERDQFERCRELVAALILHGNVAIRAQSNVLDLGDGIRLKHQHWQIFEYIVEHRDRGFSMVEISYNLSIPPSTDLSASFEKGGSISATSNNFSRESVPAILNNSFR